MSRKNSSGRRRPIELMLAALRAVRVPLVPPAPSPLLQQARTKMGSRTPAGNFSPKRGNKNFYKGKGDKKYGRLSPQGAAPPLAHWRPASPRLSGTAHRRRLGADKARRLANARPLRVSGAAAEAQPPRARHTLIPACLRPPAAQALRGLRR